MAANGTGRHISIHAPRAGSDVCRKNPCSDSKNFNPRSPCGERPWRQWKSSRFNYFNPRSPCGERRGGGYAAVRPINTFQSTLPVRGATKVLRSVPESKLNFNPRSPCGERHPCCSVKRARGDFNPRSPCGERRVRDGADPAAADFNPRSPCGERLVFGTSLFCLKAFQSTLPVRGATRARVYDNAPLIISIHAPRAGSDPICCLKLCMIQHFNPRSPCGERQQYIVLLQVQSAIYTQSAILSIVNAIKGRRLLIEFGAKACGISCVLQIRTHKASGSSTEIVSFEP